MAILALVSYKPVSYEKKRVLTMKKNTVVMTEMKRKMNARTVVKMKTTKLNIIELQIKFGCKGDQVGLCYFPITLDVTLVGNHHFKAM